MCSSIYTDYLNADDYMQDDDKKKRGEKKQTEEFARQGGRFLSPDEAAKVASVIFNAAGKMNARLVGRSPQMIGEAAGVEVGPEVRVLLAEQSGVGRKFPFSQEKLCPILAFYTEDG